MFSVLRLCLGSAGELAASAAPVRAFLPWLLAGVLVAAGLLALLADRRRILRELEAEAQRRQEAEDQLAAAEQAKIELLSTLSHEIRTPINAVLGTTELLLRRGLAGSAAEREQLATVDTSAQALLALVDDLLDLSRSEAGLLRLRPVDFSLETLVDDVVRLVGRRAAGKGLTLDVAIDGPARDLHGDVARLRQVLCNLVHNAIRFTNEGRIGIRARVEGEAESLRRLRFEVADSGVGLSPRRKARLFEPFLDGDSSAGHRRGSSLGLAISKKLIELMGGEIGVDGHTAADGVRGAIFWFQVPVGAARAPLPAAGSAEMPRFGAGRLLVVEDNPINQQVVLGQRASLGLQADSCDDGHAAIDALSERRYAAVLLDVMLPGLDGYETTRRWRQLEQELGLARTTIVAITAHAVEGERERCLAAGMDDFLAKPFRLHELAEALARHLPTGAPASPAPPSAIPVAHKVAVDPDLLDPATLEELRALSAKAKRDLLGKLAASFGPNARKLLDAIAGGMSAGDGEAVRAAAHQLKSAAGNVGARGFAELAKAVEQAARGGTPEGARDDVRRLREELPRVESALFAAAGIATTATDLPP